MYNVNSTIINVYMYSTNNNHEYMLVLSINSFDCFDSDSSYKYQTFKKNLFRTLQILNLLLSNFEL